jgi:penicillin-binding protein 1A
MNGSWHGTRRARVATGRVRLFLGRPRVTANSRRVKAVQLAAGVTVTLALIVLFAGFYLAYVYWSLPDLQTAPSALRAARTSIVYAADGSVLAEWHGEQDRKVVAFESIPRSMRDAVVAAEDPRFFEHDGVDLSAVLGAYRSGDPGARSTLTLQLARLMLADVRSAGLTRRVQQMLMAYELEARTSKERVLEAYLNTVYFGNGSYGVESAARGYFGKSVSDLTVPESAMLAGVIRSPSRFAPTSDLPVATARRDAVIASMREIGVLTPEQASAAIATPVVLAPPAQAPKSAPYFVEYVKQQLIEALGSSAVFTGGLRVYTTLEPAMQAEAEKAVAAILPAETDPEAAVVSLDPRDGRILALIGGRDFAKDQYNLAVQGRRQPGSAFKPFVLVAALESGVSADRAFDTSPYTVRVADGDWRVENYEGAFPTGTMTLRLATAWSVNAVFARLIMEVGPEKVVDAARRMGITSPLEPNPAIALGGLSKGVTPLEMASAYGTLAASGLRAAPSAVLRVEDGSGKVIYQPAVESTRAVSPEVASKTTELLREVVERGTGIAARIGVPAAGKTGTTQSYRDAWFVGYTGEICTAVWVGYRRGQIDMLDVHGIRVTGGSFPATIWNRYMSAAIARRAGAPPAGAPAATPDPSSPERLVRICVATFMLANPRCPEVYEVELALDRVPKGTCTLH